MLRPVCRVAVATWGIALFVAVAERGPASAPVEPPTEIVARIEPVAVPEPEAAIEAERAPEAPPDEPEAASEPEPEPAPEPSEPETVPETEAAQEPEPVREPVRAAAESPAGATPPPATAAPDPEETLPTPVAAHDLARGEALLGDGEFPVLTCSYDSFASFRAYARAMSQLGARFVVVHQREIVGRVDVETGVVRAAEGLSAFSPRARDYTREPGLAFLARSVRERFGASAVVMMLVPHSIDAGLFGGIARVLRDRGENHADYREIRGRYERSSGGVQLRVESGLRRDGREVALDALFDLSDLAGQGARA
jgi:hypothetical protein